MTAERVFRRKNRPHARSEPEAQAQPAASRDDSADAHDSPSPKVFRRQKRSVAPGETQAEPTPEPQQPAPKPQLVHNERPRRSAEQAFPPLASDEPAPHPETSREALLAFAEDLAFPDLTVEDDAPPARSEKPTPEAAPAAWDDTKMEGHAEADEEKPSVPPTASEPDAPNSSGPGADTRSDAATAPDAPLVLQDTQRADAPEPAPKEADPVTPPVAQKPDQTPETHPLPPQAIAPTREPEKPLPTAMPPADTTRDAQELDEADEIAAIEATPSISARAPEDAGDRARTEPDPLMAQHPEPETSPEAERIAVEAEPSPHVGGEESSDIENLFADEPTTESVEPDHHLGDRIEDGPVAPRTDPVDAGAREGGAEMMNGGGAKASETADEPDSVETDVDRDEPEAGNQVSEAEDTEPKAGQAQVTDPGAPDPDPAIAKPPTDAASPETDGALWARLAPVIVDERVLDRHRVITATRYDPAHAAFDVLRTRLLQAVAERGWSRIAITSPTKGCGKTFTAANLAISLARQENCPTILFDTDLRDPMLARTFGATATGAIGDMLRGKTAPEDHLQRLGPNSIHAGPNLAFAFNDAREAYASELLQDPRTADTLRRIEERFAPKLMLFDTPPALYGDDVLAMRPLIDAVILVVGGGLTTANEIREVENRLGTETPLLGVVLNRAEGSKTRQYGY
ncbi:Chromosome partitioning ATPase, Mrp family, contains Fe-S cluster [Roseivivax lentus]|uniref:Chromosome partitioning ATPase, Mrp family, contains Fe-S cluster n=1 Tax=Roseivivax lentus TaxID=633194 RepID=A0A1N7JVZ7_9RHOB|nr:CpsD/CapB family tyrosine-protein kinase [Roseivivax lentus]SIS53529.1 Chromosome partitioning ATPase, Mrp family, contains Fe-S cluster [Roseivivax lentus]